MGCLFSRSPCSDISNNEMSITELEWRFLNYLRNDEYEEDVENIRNACYQHRYQSLEHFAHTLASQKYDIRPAIPPPHLVKAQNGSVFVERRTGEMGYLANTVWTLDQENLQFRSVDYHVLRMMKVRNRTQDVKFKPHEIIPEKSHYRSLFMETSIPSNTGAANKISKKPKNKENSSLDVNKGHVPNQRGAVIVENKFTEPMIGQPKREPPNKPNRWSITPSRTTNDKTSENRKRKPTSPVEDGDVVPSSSKIPSPSPSTPKLYSVSSPTATSSSSIPSPSPTPPTLTQPPAPKRRKSLIGRSKGIHGANNSCYMDALLFTLFYVTTSYDNILLPGEGECENLLTTGYEEARNLKTILAKGIVEPLRNERYCPPKNVKVLREFLAKICLKETYLGGMMDVEELFYDMVEDTLGKEGFLRYADTGTTDFIHLIHIGTSGSEEDNEGTLGTATQDNAIANLQTCIEKSLSYQHLKLLTVPSPGFFVQLPRSDGELVGFTGIIPNPRLGLSRILKSAGECVMCKVKDDLWECQECQNHLCTSCLNSSILISSCGHGQRSYVSQSEMRLQAVICIASAHYTSFVRNEEDRSWLFFDSMSYNGPSVEQLGDMDRYLDEIIRNHEIVTSRSDKTMAYAQQMIRDGHICIYEPIHFVE